MLCENIFFCIAFKFLEHQGGGIDDMRAYLIFSFHGPVMLVWENLHQAEKIYTGDACNKYEVCGFLKCSIWSKSALWKTTKVILNKLLLLNQSNLWVKAFMQCSFKTVFLTDVLEAFRWRIWAKFELNLSHVIQVTKCQRETTVAGANLFKGICFTLSMQRLINSQCPNLRFQVFNCCLVQYLCPYSNYWHFIG